MKKALLDVNVVFDILFERKEHYAASSAAIALILRRKITGYISAASFNVLSYVAEKAIGRLKAMQAIRKIRLMFQVAKVDGRVIDMALASEFADFEDAIQYCSAVEAGVDCLITRDKKGYKAASGLLVLTPEEFIASV